MIQVMPPFVGSDRVNGSGGALCLTALRGAYRRVAQSRICTTVLRLAQTAATFRELRSDLWIKGSAIQVGIRPLLSRTAWGVRPLRSTCQERGGLNDTLLGQSERITSLVLIHYYSTPHGIFEDVEIGAGAKSGPLQTGLPSPQIMPWLSARRFETRPAHGS